MPSKLSMNKTLSLDMNARTAWKRSIDLRPTASKQTTLQFPARHILEPGTRVQITDNGQISPVHPTQAARGTGLVLREASDVEEGVVMPHRIREDGEAVWTMFRCPHCARDIEIRIEVLQIRRLDVECLYCDSTFTAASIRDYEVLMMGTMFLDKKPE